MPELKLTQRQCEALQTAIIAFNAAQGRLEQSFAMLAEEVPTNARLNPTERTLTWEEAPVDVPASADPQSCETVES